VPIDLNKVRLTVAGCKLSGRVFAFFASLPNTKPRAPVS
jgi:hypothetical protein